MSMYEDLYGARPAGPLFHYTSSHGLIGILREGAVWASNIKDLQSEVSALVPLGPAHDDLVSRAAQIGFVYANGGTDSEIHASYAFFVEGVGIYAKSQDISTDVGGDLLACMEDVSLKFEWEAKIKVGNWLKGRGSSSEKCQNEECKPAGPWCIQIKIKKGEFELELCVGG